jgi:hypothetical protein
MNKKQLIEKVNQLQESIRLLSNVVRLLVLQSADEQHSHDYFLKMMADSFHKLNDLQE